MKPKTKNIIKATALAISLTFGGLSLLIAITMLADKYDSFGIICLFFMFVIFIVIAAKNIYDILGTE